MRYKTHILAERKIFRIWLKTLGNCALWNRAFSSKLPVLHNNNDSNNMIIIMGIMIIIVIIEALIFFSHYGFIHTDGYMYVWIHDEVCFICMIVCTCIVCMHVHGICIYIDMCAYVYIHMYGCICVCVYRYTQLYGVYLSAQSTTKWEICQDNSYMRA